MDELELLKKDWQQQEKTLPTVSYEDIYKMIWRKSSSIVKWIFTISVIEFLLFAGVEISARIFGSYKDDQDMGLTPVLSISLSLISYCIIGYFIISFYRNYKKIQATDSIKVLMESILKTRRTVKRYVFATLTYITLTLTYVFTYMLFFNPKFQEFQNATNQGVNKIIIIGIFIIAIIIIVGMAGSIYYLLYGLLTKRLKKNYKILKKLEV